jgi:energy-coupling factor transport system ATP-binding protein
LKEENVITVISITHDLEEAAKADRMIIMNEGKLYREGKPTEIFQMENELIKLGLDIPFSVKLGNILKESGVGLTGNHLTEEELVKDLCELYSKM